MTKIHIAEWICLVTILFIILQGNPMLYNKEKETSKMDDRLYDAYMSMRNTESPYDSAYRVSQELIAPFDFYGNMAVDGLGFLLDKSKAFANTMFPQEEAPRPEGYMDPRYVEDPSYWAGKRYWDEKYRQ